MPFMRPLAFAQNFERKSALFSLTLCEVLVINMWAADVGRYSGSNAGVLRAIFELYMDLFKENE